MIHTRNASCRLVIASWMVAVMAGWAQCATAAGTDNSLDGWQVLAPANSDMPVNAVIPAGAPTTEPPLIGANGTSPVPPITPAAGLDASAGVFDLQAGKSLQSQLEGWAKRAGWSVMWSVPDDWLVPGNESYGGDFASAVQRVVEQLAANGADVRADVWNGNHSVVIHPTGATE